MVFPAVRLTIISAAAFIALLAPHAAHGQDDTTRLARLQAQMDAVVRELESLRLGRDFVPQADTSLHGFGPAASKVYQVRQGVSIGGYGEVLYENFAGEREDGVPSGRTDRLDALRAIIYIGYKFNDRLLFNSEVEFEHGNTENNGSVSLEFGYLEYRLSSRFGVRAGLLLPPMGFINEMHEPPIFLGARRPETERQIIPSTWRENGIGVFGEAGALSYRAYLVNGFNGAGFSAGGVRDGRQNGSEAAARHFGVVGRLEYNGAPGLLLATSAYRGNSGQSDSISAQTVLWEGHAEYRARGFELRGLYARATVGDVAELNAQNGLAGNASIGERMTGWYLQAGYDVLRIAHTTSQLIPFVRYEKLNTQAEVPTGFAANPANDRSILTVGASWKPLANVAFKADYQFLKNEAETGVNQVNLAMGYLF